jgi:cytoskeletal protein RodZ
MKMMKIYNIKKDTQQKKSKHSANSRMVTVGNLLKKRREDLSKTIAQVSNETKISDTKLFSMESNDFSCFESPVHASGFIKIYADYLGLDTNKILAVYRRDYKDSNLRESIRKPVEKQKKGRKWSFSQYTLLILPLLLILIILSYLYVQYHNFQNPPSLEIVEPTNNTIVEEDQIILKGKTEKDTIITINNQAVSVDEEYFFQKNVSLQPGKNIITVKATNIRNSSRESIEIFTVQYIEQLITESDDKDEEEKISEIIEISLEITNSPTWIEIIKDDQLVISQILEVGFKETFLPDRNISISTGIVENTNIEINGEKQTFSSDKFIFVCNILEEEIECN